MARRFRCICRATAQVGREPQTPKWAETLTWLCGHVGKEASHKAIGDMKKLQAPRQYFYGWSKEVMKAWRQVDEKAPKELSIKMQEPPDAAETDTMQAVVRTASSTLSPT